MPDGPVNLSNQLWLKLTVLLHLLYNSRKKGGGVSDVLGFQKLGTSRPSGFHQHLAGIQYNVALHSGNKSELFFKINMNMK